MDVKATLQKYWPIINNSKNLEVLHDKNVVICNRRNKHLRDIPVKYRRLNEVSGEKINVCAYNTAKM